MNQSAIATILDLATQKLAHSQKRLSKAEREVLELALRGIPPTEMEQHLGEVKPAAIRKRLGVLYRKWEILGDGPGKFDRLVRELRSLQPTGKTDPTTMGLAVSPSPDLPSPDLSNTDALEGTELLSRGDSIEQQFVGRADELKSLWDWILTEQCSIVAIWGIAGIGKTHLLAKLLHSFHEKALLSSSPSKTGFQGISRICLSDGMTPLQCVQKILNQLDRTTEHHSEQHHRGEDKADESKPKLARQAEELNTAVNDLMRILKTDRYLIVLDGYEGVLGTAQPGKYAEEYKGYDDLLLRIATVQHQSCLVLTSREKPRSLGVNQALNVKILPLKGLKSEDARTLLQTKEISKEPLAVDEQSMDELIDLYRGNPLWLKVAATTINEFFDGNIAQFLSAGKLIYDEQKSALKPQFSRLSLAEHEVMSWLAINRQPVSLETLQGDIFDGPHQADLVYTLRALERRSLLDPDPHPPGLYGLQPVVLEFATNRLINCIADELTPLRRPQESDSLGDRPPREEDCFNRYCLVKADAEEYLQQRQRQFLLRPLYEKLLSRAGSPEQLQNILQQRLQQRRQHQTNVAGYFGGNLLNLWAEMRQANDLFPNEPAPQDFSALPIWQASFQAPFTELNLERFSFESCAIERASFIENLGDVFALAFNLPQPGEDRPTHLAAGDSNGRLHLWQLPEMKKRMDWQGHQSWVRSLVLGPDGRWLVTGGDDNFLRLWDLQLDMLSQPQPLVVYEQECEDWVRAIALAPNQEILAFSSGSDLFLHRLKQRSRLTTVTPWLRLTHLHQLPNEQLVRQPHLCVRALAFSPCGRWLASGGDDNRIDVWDFQQLLADYPFDAHPSPQDSQLDVQPYAILRRHRGWVRSLCFSPQSDRLISSSDDGTVQIWNIVGSPAARRPATTAFEPRQPSFKDHFERVRCTAISGDGRVLASGGDDCQLRLWDLERAEPLALTAPIPPAQGRIWSIALGQRQGELLLAYGDDAQTIHLQALVPSPAEILAKPPDQPSDQPPDQPDSPSHLPSFERRPLRTLQGYSSSIRTARFVANLADPSGLPWIISGGDNHKLQLWDFPQDFSPASAGASSPSPPPRPLLELSGHQGRIWQTAYHSESQILASASDDKTIRLWNLATQDCLQVLVDHSYWVRTVAFDRPGLTLASAGDDETICLWDVRSGVCLQRLGQRRNQGSKTSQAQAIAGHHHWIRTVAFSRDGKILASGGDGRRVLLWNWAAQPTEPIRDLGLQAHRIRMVAFSNNGQWLASGNDNGDVWLWRYPDLEGLGDKTVGPGELQPAVKWRHDRWGVKAIAFSPCDRQLATVGDDQTIYLWTLPEGSDSEQIDSKSLDLQQLASKQPPQKLQLPLQLGNSRGFQSVAFSPDGRYLVTGDREAWIELWQLQAPSNPNQQPRYLGRMTPPRPYEGMNITHVTGLDAVQRAGLKALGAVERSPILTHFSEQWQK